MGKHSRQKVIAGNWKMHKTISQTVHFIEELAPLVKDVDCQVLIAPPFTSLWHAAEKSKKTPIIIGVQNISQHVEGAYTGEVSAKMVKEAGAQFAIIGHSERRRYFGETNQIIGLKMKRAIEEGLDPILCIGETLEENKEGRTEDILQKQLQEALQGFTAQELKSAKLAYEPVWAIGTNLAATPEIAEKAHKFCRKQIESLFGKELAEKMPILYGGSVNGGNSKDMLALEEIDGFLVGGASLTVDGFSKIIHYQQLHLR